MFSFYTDRIIYNPVEIDRIVREHADEVVGVRFCPEKFNPTDWPLPFIWANDLLHTAGFNGSSCCLKDKWKLVGEYEAMFNEYQGAVSSCVGVHARLGNGEQNLSEGRERMKIPWDRFFLEMDSYQDGKFFVCGDTPSFLDKCSDKYGDRVIYFDRFMPPENCGPGHNIWSIYDRKKASEYITERSHVGPYRLIGEALIEMFLLGECKRLVCNKSAFTHYARECCKVNAVVLECTKDEIEIDGYEK